MIAFRKRAKAEDGARSAALQKADRDIVTLGIAAAALILFVGTGGTIMPQVLDSWFGTAAPPDLLLTNALLLNIALVIFGWRRYTELRREVEERRRAEETARLLAETDPLTGCLNRRSANARIDELIQAARENEQAAAVLVLDLDNFKQVNDQNGHQVGDAVLREAAARLTREMPVGGILARTGGDEFACAIAFESDDQERIEKVVLRILEAMGKPITHEESEYGITVSIGIARSDADAEREDERKDAEWMLHCADIAMYHAKGRGRNCHVWFEPRMESDFRFRRELENGIREGLGRGEFVPYYERQIALGSGELTGFEMLARWHSPKLGTVLPEVFIPVAEDMELISELSEQLIRRALDDAKEWDANLSLAINISPLQLRDPWFAQKLLKILSESGFPPHRLDVEITESCLHENPAMVRSILVSLKNQGVRVSLDDFGTGYSNLSQLRSLPFDRLKIDRSFVTELGGESDSGAMVGAIVALGRSMGMPIVAEGVENETVLAQLAKLGELEGQGYFYGHPADAAATREMLRKEGRLAGDAQRDQPGDEGLAKAS
ncbi:putative bifunctional diguanylate cyclase/phosphodiesterase [Paraurantiacibacter namhicola]|uniref:Phytochrome-like protein cph2 n=1 Tax=Paraurantiacibacter namhicola TaxID=645517 RepID=A0A1C7DAB5_9SPHN|nr:EAL domain-containing protein [Paraurantiacibacter namhicola]ANU08243.1 Phytochrome-like protein cph2 [Paraurantiacibacter namhicola]